MKLIITILRDHDSESVSQGLIASGFRVTRIASTGGFLRRGSSTLMIGVADDKVEEAVSNIRGKLNLTTDPLVNRATLFILNVESYEQI
jgi:uncharacterized protein YaaQ